MPAALLAGCLCILVVVVEFDCYPAGGEKLYRRSIFLTEAPTPRRGRRVLPVTMGHHHTPFEPAGTARGLARALDLVGALLALWRAERGGAREKGFDQYRRKIHASQHQRVFRDASWDPGD